jgi:hypothetical protein
MHVRLALVAMGLVAASPLMAEPLAPDTARSFIAGKLFAYNCFDGTRGAGRIFSDGSVAGTIQVRGAGPARHVMLPPGTLKIKGQSYCASVRGLPMEPCFNVNRTTEASFRGSLYGLGFAYCDFTRSNGRPTAVRAALGLRPSSMPLQLHGAASESEASASASE